MRIVRIRTCIRTFVRVRAARYPLWARGRVHYGVQPRGVGFWGEVVQVRTRPESSFWPEYEGLGRVQGRLNGLRVPYTGTNIHQYLVRRAYTCWERTLLVYTGTYWTKFMYFYWLGAGRYS